METKTLKISGMSCGHCVEHVRKALQGLPGMAVVNVAIGSATVSYDPATVNEAAMSAAIADAGYAVEQSGQAA
jgi:Cu2+-exporting ATPase